MAKKKQGKYSRVSKERQHANKVARDRRYRANQRQLAKDAVAIGAEIAGPVADRDQSADTINAAAETEPEGGAPVPTPPQEAMDPGMAAERH